MDAFNLSSHDKCKGRMRHMSAWGTWRQGWQHAESGLLTEDEIDDTDWWHEANWNWCQHSPVFWPATAVSRLQRSLGTHCCADSVLTWWKRTGFIAAYTMRFNHTIWCTHNISSVSHPHCCYKKKLESLGLRFIQCMLLVHVQVTSMLLTVDLRHDTVRKHVIDSLPH